MYSMGVFISIGESCKQYMNNPNFGVEIFGIRPPLHSGRKFPCRHFPPPATVIARRESAEAICRGTWLGERLPRRPGPRPRLLAMTAEEGGWRQQRGGGEREGAGAPTRLPYFVPYRYIPTLPFFPTVPLLPLPLPSLPHPLPSLRGAQAPKQSAGEPGRPEIAASPRLEAGAPRNDGGGRGNGGGGTGVAATTAGRGGLLPTLRRAVLPGGFCR
jgi:hypothetical protein